MLRLKPEGPGPEKKLTFNKSSNRYYPRINLQNALTFCQDLKELQKLQP